MAEWLQDVGKSFKLGFGLSPSRSFSALVHHCSPLYTILYARNLYAHMREPLREALQSTSPWQYPRLIREGANADFGPTYDTRRNATAIVPRKATEAHTKWLRQLLVAGFAPLAIGRN